MRRAYAKTRACQNHATCYSVFSHSEAIATQQIVVVVFSDALDVLKLLIVARMLGNESIIRSTQTL